MNVLQSREVQKSGDFVFLRNPITKITIDCYRLKYLPKSGEQLR